MLFTPLLLLATTALAFTIPRGQPDGVYSVTHTADGTEVHNFIRALNATVEARDIVPGKFSVINKRQVSGVTNDIGCGGYNLPSGDTDAANNALDAQCGNGASVNGGDDFYSLSGCVVAYFCNLTGGQQFCYASERQEASAGITNVCGRYWAGWDHIDSTTRTDQYGYENNCNQGSNFCGRGTGG